MQDIEKLIDELLKQDLRPNTREDLAVWRKENATGALAADDARYIRALHARVVGGEPAAGETRDDAPPSGKAKGDPLRAELAEARRREEALIAERDRLRDEIAALRREIEALKANKG